MLLKSIRRMHSFCFEGRWRWTHHFLLVIWLSLMTANPTKALGYFLGDTKAVLNGCEDHWTLQDSATMPLLLQMTLCVDIRVVVPGAWVAFSYSSVLAPGPELGLEGDDEALYGWLLRVRHRFPMRLSPTQWHRVCLRRDVSRNSFSLEVNGKMVAARTVIAQAIPPNGSLWLGCRPRDRPPGAVLGEVELYLFRMWADVGNHGLCEDGTVIGWNAQSWGLTSPRARQRDPNLLCVALPTGFGRLFPPPPEVPSTTTSSSTVIATPVTHMSNQMSKATVSTPPGTTTVNSIQTEPPSVTPSANHSTETKPSNFQNSYVTPSPNGIPLSILTPVNQTTASNTDLPFTTVPVTGASSAHQMSASTQNSLITSLLVNQSTPGGPLTSGFPLVNCDTSQLCSNTNAYFWMPISVTAQGDNKTEQDVHNLVSNVFSCHSNAAHGVTGFIDFCQGDGQLQAVLVNCSAKSNIRQTTCDMVLQLSHAVSACELQRAGVSALQQAGDQEIQVKIIGEVERVGRDICGDVEPSSGRLVRCTSTSSLEEICQANNHSKLTCSLIQPNSNPAPQPNTESCSSEVPRFCDCTAFCNSASQFFAMRININSASFNVDSLKVLLSGLGARTCNPMSG
ncbi:adhesion G-protein coupled receptor G4 isoform X2 [Etheostoma cragini]|uniref:adhesion G-protein coupled receptor G4 isoform X2 n=1 Tax=Etheostoma cragini TaxID=417921 RepID=UPI00155DEA4F|nr:adhesion G-protein coupled receptor G4 isoform X2 [Etheostoma cragini]